jgi:hypothetical protein
MFRPDKTNGDKGDAFLDLGNAPEFSVTLESENLDHFSSRAGIQVKDLSLITQVTLTGGFTLDEPDSENLALYFMSKQTDSRDQVAVTKPTLTDGNENIESDLAADVNSGTVSVPTGGLGKWYPLNIKSATPVRAHNISDLDVYDGLQTSTPNTLVEGGYASPQTAHYELDAGSGMIFIHNPQPASNPIVAGTTVLYLYGAVDAMLASADEDIRSNFGFTLTAQKGHFYFAGVPPQGQAIDLLGYGSLTPTGDMAFVGDDWSQFQFEIEFLEHADYQDASGNQGLVQVINRDQIG